MQDWQESIVHKVSLAAGSGRLHHAILLDLGSSLDISILLKQLAEVIILSKLDDLVHPDINVLIQPEGQIRLDDVKSVLEPIYLKSFAGGNKLVIIDPVDRLNESAVNALLKTLEEPPENSYFLLICRQMHGLKPTLKSRVQSLKVNIADKEIRRHLKRKFAMQDDDIDKALMISRNDLAIIERVKNDKHFWQIRRALFQVLLQKANVIDFARQHSGRYSDILYWLASLMVDCYYVKLGVNQNKLANFNEWRMIQHIANKCSAEDIYQCYQKILCAIAQVHNNSNINRQLMLEFLLFELNYSG
ncbi:MAG: DNA polymerase III subunit delta' C-terminal domain-containing protein [Francisellaceae bacterium]